MLDHRKASLPIFLFISVILFLGANIAHPFTPLLFNVLNMPDYMFGLAFSLMAFTSFFFAPTWGNKSDHVGRIKILCICTIGYAFGQFLFSISTSMLTIVIARLVSGTFSGGWTVMSIAYVSDLSSVENKGRNMSIFVAMQSLACSLGFLCGGFMADSSIRFAFNVQIIILLVAATLFFLLLKDVDTFVPNKQPSKTFENPLKSFLQAKNIITPTLLVFFIIVAIASFCTQAMDNGFNYYLNTEFGLPPSFNGKVKAFIGVTSLIANFTINMWIVKYTNWHKTLSILFFLCSSAMIMVCLATSQSSLVVFSVICFILNSIFLPLMQSILTTKQQQDNAGILAGMYHSFMYIGKVLGPLMAGILYGYGSKLPFIVITFTYIVVTILSLINAKQFRAKQN